MSAVLQPWVAPPRSAHDGTRSDLGALGAFGTPPWYLQSQKLVLFNAIVSIVVGLDLAFGHLGEQGLTADPILSALLAPAVLAIALSPVTFLMYNWCTAVEGLKDSDALRKVLASQRQRSFATKICTLATLSECFSVCTQGGCFVPETPVAMMPWAALREGAQRDDDMLNLLAVFDMADRNRDGWLSYQELGLIASRLRFELDELSLNSFIDQAKAGSQDASPCSVDGDCLISFPEFATVVLNQQGAPTAVVSETEVCRRVFGFFDQNSSGTVSVGEMTAALEQMGFDAAGTEQLFYDITGRQRDDVSYDQFAEYFATVWVTRPAVSR